MDADKLDRAAAYRFLRRLIAKNSDDAVGTLMDIVVDYWLFPNGDGDTTHLTDLEKRVADLMAANDKLGAIKLARDTLGVGLKEAKEFVEQRAWPTGSKETESEKMRRQFVARTVQKIATDHQVEL